MKNKYLIAAILACWMQGAQSLGLGEAVTHSWLGEPLSVQIPISDAEGWQAHQLKISLVDDSGAHSRDLSAKIDEQDNHHSIRLLSTVPIREPALQLSVELRWPEGQLRRQYLLLLDPPPIP